jgi:hypothetical protein
MMLQQMYKGPAFIEEVVLTYESYFTRTELTKIRNEYMCSEESPHAIRYQLQRRQFPINLWDGILGDCLKKSIILQASVFVHDYLKFPRKPLSRLRQDAAFSTCLHMLFGHIGAPKPYTSEMRYWLPKNDPGLQAHRN